MGWQRLIHFLDEHGAERYGEPCIGDAEELYALLGREELFANVWTGTGPFDLHAAGEKCKVNRLLPVLERHDVPIVKCIGLNYAKHSTTCFYTANCTRTDHYC